MTNDLWCIALSVYPLLGGLASGMYCESRGGKAWEDGVPIVVFFGWPIAITYFVGQRLVAWWERWPDPRDKVIERNADALAAALVEVERLRLELAEKRNYR